MARGRKTTLVSRKSVKRSTRRRPTKRRTTKRGPTKRRTTKRRPTKRRSTKRRTTKRRPTKRPSKKSVDKAFKKELKGLLGSSYDTNSVTLSLPKKSKSKSKSKSKGPSPYNKFVKKMSPILRSKNPGLKQPQIMKLIAKEWNKKKTNNTI